MKIPKYIDQALKKRTRCANQLMDACCIVDDFLQKHSIYPPDEDWLTGVEIYANPYEAEKEVRKAIEQKGEE